MNRKHRKEKKKLVRPTRNSRAEEIKYRKELDALVGSLKDTTASNLIPILKALQSEYVTDGYAKTLEETFNRMRMSYENIGRQAAIVSNSFVTGSDQVNKKRFYSAMQQAVGVDLQSIVQREDLEDVLVATTRENISLIKSIPEEYFKKIESIVFTGTTQGRNSQSMIKQIKDLNKSTTKRAKLIARDQSSKLNSALNQKRQQNLGIEEYIWRTAGDGRVRPDHDSKNGKVFRWDKPPADTGHPGQDIQCRCVAQPIIKF